MKRKEVLIYRILEWIEEYAGERSLSSEEIPNYHLEEVNEHVRLCLEAGLIESEPKFGPGKGIPKIVGWRIRRLTWEGHQKLDGLRSAEIPGP